MCTTMQSSRIGGVGSDYEGGVRAAAAETHDFAETRLRPVAKFEPQGRLRPIRLYRTAIDSSDARVPKCDTVFRDLAWRNVH